MFARVGGILVVMFGLYQLGFRIQFPARQRAQVPLKLDTLAMSPFTALVMGFTFSFAWTPCVGPGFSQCPSDGGVSQHPGDGICADWRIYGRFCSAVPRSWPVYDIASGFFKSHMNVFKYTVRIGGILMVFLEFYVHR